MLYLLKSVDVVDQPRQCLEIYNAIHRDLTLHLPVFEEDARLGTFLAGLDMVTDK